LEYNLASANNQWTGKAFYLENSSLPPIKTVIGILPKQFTIWNEKSRSNELGAVQEESVERQLYRTEVGFVS